MKIFQRSLLIALMFVLGTDFCNATSVKFYVESDKGEKLPPNVEVAERNLASVLDAINTAYFNNTRISNRNLRMSEFAKKSIESIYASSPFYCTDEDITSHVWVYSDGFEARRIPLNLTHKGEKFGDESFVFAVAEFDNSGTVTDFRLQLSAHDASRWGELDSVYNEVTDQREQFIVLKTLEHFRTAYCQKDIKTIEDMFSDDALIITGRVTQRVTQGDKRMMTSQVTYNRQTKQQYIANLKKAFLRNKFVKVEFDPESIQIKRSDKDHSMFGIRLTQSWESTNYSDKGTLFLIFQFPEGRDPIIHVRTWTPEGFENDDISTLSGFGL